MRAPAEDPIPREASLAAAVRWIGRADLRRPEAPRFAWSGSGFAAEFHGSALVATLENQAGFMFKAVVDARPQPPFTVEAGRASYTIAAGLAPGPHWIELYRQTEAEYGESQLCGLAVSDGALCAPPSRSARLIEVIGDSISTGYGNLARSATCAFSFSTQSHYDSYAAVAARAWHAELSTIALSGRGLARNPNGTTDTMPGYYPRALPSEPGALASSEPHPQAVVIALGTNDFMTGDPGPVFEHAYFEFASAIRRRHPDALIVCMIGPMLSDEEPPGERHLSRHRERVHAAARRFTGEHDANIACLEHAPNRRRFGADYHPNAACHRDMGIALANLLRERLGP